MRSVGIMDVGTGSSGSSSVTSGGVMTVSSSPDGVTFEVKEEVGEDG